MIKRGVLLNVITITEEDAVAKGENLWRVIEVVGDAVCLQCQDSLADKFGNVKELFWMRKSELEANPNLVVVQE